jgi:hypothetical protein
MEIFVASNSLVMQTIYGELLQTPKKRNGGASPAIASTFETFSVSWTSAG